MSQRKGKAPGPFHKAILLLPPGKAPNLACSRQMDLLSHVRSFTQKHSEAVKRRKKKGERKKRKGWGGRGGRACTAGAAVSVGNVLRGS